MTSAIGNALFASAWQGAAIAALLFVALRAIPHDYSRIRYGVSVSSLAAMLCGFLLAFVEVALMPAASRGIVATGIDWPASIWLCGVAAITAYRAAGWLLLHHRIRRCTAPALAAWEDLLHDLRPKMRAGRNVSLLRADWLNSPAVYGVLKPVILIPAAAVAGLSPRQLEAILAHELAHVLRHDYLLHLLQAFAETLLFHHPAAWWIGRQIRQERECCCDQLAAQATGDRIVLAQALLAIEEHRAMPPAIAATGGNLRMRIERLTGVHRPARLSTAWIAAIAILATAAHIAAWQETPPAPYGKWLTEDVAYIIQLEERKAFLALKSNEERENFIVQFWSRRDPTPQTGENEAKEEHYRRIAYSNELYGAQGTAGWKTDRGKMYILAGPPDEIFSWPVQALERWIYKPKDRQEEKYEFRDGKLQPAPR